MYVVKDLEKSAKFYEEVIGLKRRWTDTEKQMIGFTFKESDSELVLHTDPSIPNYDFSFLVDNVEQFCNEFKKQGYKVKLEIIHVRCGKYAILLDPNGNIIPIIDLTKFGGKPKYDK
jgi:predicted enzyme related to lactoylglutathione lyase